MSFHDARRADGTVFKQWRPDHERDTPPEYGPTHAVNNYCIFCGSRWFRRPIIVDYGHGEIESYREDIVHDFSLHHRHRPSSGSGDDVQLTLPRRSHFDEDDL